MLPPEIRPDGASARFERASDEPELRTQLLALVDLRAEAGIKAIGTPAADTVRRAPLFRCGEEGNEIYGKLMRMAD
jgi:hypothetical protein